MRHTASHCNTHTHLLSYTCVCSIPEYIRNIFLAKAGEGGLANYDESGNEMLDVMAAVEGEEGSQDSMGLGGVDLDLLENPSPDARARGNAAAAVASASSSAPAPAPASGGISEGGGVESGIGEIGGGARLAHPGGGVGGEEEEGGQVAVRGEEGVVGVGSDGSENEGSVEGGYGYGANSYFDDDDADNSQAQRGDCSACGGTNGFCMARHAANCNTLLHTVTHGNTLQHTATHCTTLQHTAAYYNTLQHTAQHTRVNAIIHMCPLSYRQVLHELRRKR